MDIDTGQARSAASSIFETAGAVESNLAAFTPAAAPSRIKTDIEALVGAEGRLAARVKGLTDEIAKNAQDLADDAEGADQ